MNYFSFICSWANKALYLFVLLRYYMNAWSFYWLENRVDWSEPCIMNMHNAPCVRIANFKDSDSSGFSVIINFRAFIRRFWCSVQLLSFTRRAIINNKNKRLTWWCKYVGCSITIGETLAKFAVNDSAPSFNGELSHLFDKTEENT